MCGIAGWYRRTGRPVHDAIIGAQCSSIRHRGPDDAGIYTDGDFGFGMRRLSILDLPSGHQPMSSADGRYLIVFNGEVFNHEEVRDLAGSYPYRTRSDTETILAAFQLWGDAAWAKLEGMFAVAIWDRLERRLSLARDPLGIKPLYITEQNGGLGFASELKALRHLPEHRFDVDDRAVHDFFSFGHVRRPRAIFSQVRTLEPGTHLTLDRTGSLRERTFWRPRILVSRDASHSEMVDQAQAMLVETTRRHLQSDVPVGAFLSGGVDSSTVVASMVRAGASGIKTFTVGHPGSAIDETDAAAEVARHLGCEHITLRLDSRDAARSLPEILACYDEPFADPAAIPTWFASRLAAEHVKVVLCGEGGDELFAGYKRHRNARLVERFRPLLRSTLPLGKAVGRIPTWRSARLAKLRHHASRLAEFVALRDGYQQFFAATRISDSGSRRSLYATGFAERLGASAEDVAALEEQYFRSADAPRAALDQFLHADLTVNMPSAMLTRLDRASMAHSVEARVPLLSHRFVDWALTVPTRLKLRGGKGKRLLREAAAPWLPPSVMRRRKQGFQIPHSAWLRGEFGRYAQDVWHGSGAGSAGYLDAGAVDRLFEEHRRGAAEHARLLYAVAAFAIWWRDCRGPSLSLAA